MNIFVQFQIAMRMKLLGLGLLVLLTSQHALAQDRTIINEHLSIVYFQKSDGQRVEPYLYKNRISELFVEVSAMRDICDVEVELWNTRGEQVEILQRTVVNGVVGITFNTLNEAYLELKIFSKCREIVMLNTTQGLINLTGRKKIGGAQLLIH